MPRLLFLLLTCLLLLPLTASAEWTARLSAHAPEYFLAADKSRKLLFQVERQTEEPVVTRQFDCIHGRREGDKQKEGDLRTPEGVYFITHKITQKLDFMEYGPHAFNLNYPNPADRLRGKTGGGIWLHSKGQPIEGLTTRGCMAIDRYEIEDLVPLLAPGTPVIVAEHLEGAPFLPVPEKTLPAETPPQTEEAPAQAGSLHAQAEETPPPASGFFSLFRRNVEEPPVQEPPREEAPTPPAPEKTTPLSAEGERILNLTLLWMDNREQRSEVLFDLYDRENYPRAGRETFSALRKRLRSDFNAQKELFLDREGIRLMEGPGYWVSCFMKSYMRKGTLHHGLQGLYWIPEEDGSFRIIGEVWIES